MINEAWHNKGLFIERCSKCNIPTCFINQSGCGNSPCGTKHEYISYRKIKWQNFLRKLKLIK